ncbi:MAG: aminopeptidase P family protein [Burkholderiales bacterium]|nr:aminopeptidase P family protein [Burkholderiales bacterium]
MSANLQDLEPRLQAILQQEYPRFSEAEYERRRAALAAAMEKHGCDHLLVVTDHRAGNAPQWLTGWPGTAEAYVVFRPGEPMLMHMEWHNHVPLARRLARDVDVRWGGHRGIALTVAELKRRGAKRVGLIGPLTVAKFRQLEAAFDMALLDADYTQLRMRKSAEEIDWLRIGAALSDAGLRALVAGTRPGMDERELAALVEGAYTGLGGTTMIHYIGVTSMDAPHLHVPPQYASARKVRAGDIVSCELSAYWWDYPGQVLRTFTVDAEATPRYRDLHATAEAVFDAVTAVLCHGATMEEILEATAEIERRGYTVCDDLVHGFGGGYFQPIIGTKSRMAGHALPRMTLEENMTVVVQPNPVTTEADESKRSGVQVGELLRITRDGCEHLHRVPRGLFRAGQVL